MRRLRDLRELQPHFGGRGRLAGVAAVEDDVFHALAAQALGALLAQHPRDGVDDVALAAPVGPDDGGDAIVEAQLGAVGKALEAGDVQSGKTHGRRFRAQPSPQTADGGGYRIGSGVSLTSTIWRGKRKGRHKIL